MLKKWERIRAKGRTWFILLRGVLFPLVGTLLFLLLLVVLAPADVAGIPLKPFLVGGFAVGLLVYLPFGLLWTRALWETDERLFLEAEQEKPPPVSPPVPSDQGNACVDGNGPMPGVVTEEERRWASFAHQLTTVAFLLPILIPAALMGSWLLYARYWDKSKYVAFHALQTLYLQNHHDSAYWARLANDTSFADSARYA
jgi:hypothetical protein